MLKPKQLILINSVFAFFLLLCLFDLPYGYYQLIRFAAAVVFILNGSYFYYKDKMFFAIIGFALAILFQPLIKIALGRTLWNLIDVIVAAGLFYISWYINKEERTGV